MDWEPEKLRGAVQLPEALGLPDCDVDGLEDAETLDGLLSESLGDNEVVLCGEELELADALRELVGDTDAERLSVASFEYERDSSYDFVWQRSVLSLHRPLCSTHH